MTSAVQLTSVHGNSSPNGLLYRPALTGSGCRPPVIAGGRLVLSREIDDGRENCAHDHAGQAGTSRKTECRSSTGSARLKNGGHMNGDKFDDEQQVPPAPAAPPRASFTHGIPPDDATAVVQHQKLERAMGIEPTTYSLGSCRSTTELRPLIGFSSRFTRRSCAADRGRRVRLCPPLRPAWELQPGGDSRKHTTLNQKRCRHPGGICRVGQPALYLNRHFAETGIRVWQDLLLTLQNSVETTVDSSHNKAGVIIRECSPLPMIASIGTSKPASDRTAAIPASIWAVIFAMTSGVCAASTARVRTVPSCTASRICRADFNRQYCAKSAASALTKPISVRVFRIFSSELNWKMVWAVRQWDIQVRVVVHGVINEAENGRGIVVPHGERGIPARA